MKQSGRTDVKVTGLGLPNACKPYLNDGVHRLRSVLWNTGDLGYLTVHVATALARALQGPGTRRSGRPPRPLEVRGDNVILGTPFTFTKANVDRFDF